MTFTAHSVVENALERLRTAEQRVENAKTHMDIEHQELVDRLHMHIEQELPAKFDHEIKEFEVRASEKWSKRAEDVRREWERKNDEERIAREQKESMIESEEQGRPNDGAKNHNGNGNGNGDNAGNNRRESEVQEKYDIDATVTAEKVDVGENGSKEENRGTEDPQVEPSIQVGEVAEGDLDLDILLAKELEMHR